MLSIFTTNFPPKLDYDHSIINNFILFTLDSFYFTDFKTLLLNFNDSKAIFVYDFLYTPKSFIYLISKVYCLHNIHFIYINLLVKRLN